TDQDLLESRKLLPPPELAGKPGQQDFHLRADSKELFEKVGRAFGLEPIFDTAYQPKTGLRFEAQGADVHDAFRALEATTDSFAVPLNSHQFIVANETAAKRTEFDRTAAIVIPVPEPFAVQEVQEIATAIRGTLDIQRLMVDSQRRLMLIRDRTSKVRMAEKLVNDLMRPKAQVAVEVELITTDETSSLTYGMSLPNAVALVWFGQQQNLSTTYPSGYSGYLTFGGGNSRVGLGISNASLFANVSKASSKSLLKAEIVSSDGQAATLHVGDKYPIQTNAYLGTSTGAGQLYTPPPSFNFEDLGLSLKITPHVHGTDEIGLEVESEFKLLGSSAVDGIPVISSRKFQSKVSVMTGEWAILAGLMTNTEGQTVSGIAGLSVIPVLRNNSKTRDHGETLIVLKPHLLNLPPTETSTRAAWVGTETKPRPAI
ncbi:MAG: type II and III secretion system protein, partial [Acidobacteriaceae bacterium]|nr:type II and III secretion system protein [Acidobacteriaceae bacterium]